MTAVSGDKTNKSGTAGIVLRVSGGLLQLLINIAFYIIIVILVIRAATFAYDFAYRIFGDTPYDAASTREVEITILKGESTMNVATKLETNKIIEDRYSFYLKIQLKEAMSDSGKASAYMIMPGTFVLSPSMSYDDILDIITDYSKSIDQDETTVSDQEQSP